MKWVPFTLPKLTINEPLKIDGWKLFPFEDAIFSGAFTVIKTQNDATFEAQDCTFYAWESQPKQPLFATYGRSNVSSIR